MSKLLFTVFDRSKCSFKLFHCSTSELFTEYVYRLLFYLRISLFYYLVLFFIVLRDLILIPLFVTSLCISCDLCAVSSFDLSDISFKLISKTNGRTHIYFGNITDRIIYGNTVAVLGNIVDKFLNTVLACSVGLILSTYFIGIFYDQLRLKLVGYFIRSTF